MLVEEAQTPTHFHADAYSENFLKTLALSNGISPQNGTHSVPEGHEANAAAVPNRPLVGSGPKKLSPQFKPLSIKVHMHGVIFSCDSVFPLNYTGIPDLN